MNMPTQMPPESAGEARRRAEVFDFIFHGPSPASGEAPRLPGSETGMESGQPRPDETAQGGDLSATGGQRDAAAEDRRKAEVLRFIFYGPEPAGDEPPRRPAGESRNDTSRQRSAVVDQSQGHLSGGRKKYLVIGASLAAVSLIVWGGWSSVAWRTDRQLNRGGNATHNLSAPVMPEPNPVSAVPSLVSPVASEADPATVPTGTSLSKRPSAETASGKDSIPQRIQVDGDVQQTRLLLQPHLDYPPLAKAARVQGIVKFHAILSKDGHVQQLNLINGHPLLVQAALDAVKQWVYRPTLIEGVPAEVETQIDVKFVLLYGQK
jgi:TonB family protein